MSRQIPPASARLVAGLAVAALLVGACGASTPTPVASAASPAPTAAPTPSPPLPSPSVAAEATLLLEARAEGGFINPAGRIGELPLVVVDTAGRIYLPDPTLGGSMIPAVSVRDTGPAGAAAILEAARRAGLADGTAGGGGVMADTGAVVVTLEVDGSEVVTRIVGAGGPPIGAPGLSPDPGAPGPTPNPGAAAADLIAQLTDPALAWGGATAGTAPLRPSAYRVWVAPADAAVDATSGIAWPIAGDPPTFGSPAAADFGVTGLRSGVVGGGEATSLESSLKAVAAGTPLIAGGKAWQVWVSPVLPAATGG